MRVRILSLFLGLLILLLVGCESPVTPPAATQPTGQTRPPITPTPTAPATPVTPQLVPGDWPGFLSHNGGYNQDETSITVATASHLEMRWMVHAKGIISAQPIEANNLIYWGSWDGLEHATDVNGHEVWATKVGWTHTCGATIGVGSTATVAVVTIGGRPTSVVFVGGGNAHLYALDAMTGKILWNTSLGSPPSHFLWSSPLVYHARVYIGMASFGACPTVQGQLISLNAATGAIQHTFNVVPNGCQGGGVWSSPILDASAGTIYFATGNADTCATSETFASALMEVRASNLSLVGFWQIPPSEQVIDSDFGATPILFTASLHGISHALIGVANKNGIYYALQRGALGKGPLWEMRIAQGGPCPNCGQGSISSGAWDGSRLYMAGGNTTIQGQECKGSLRALAPTTGAFLWQVCLSDGEVLAPVTVVPGVVVVEAGHRVILVDASSGKSLFAYKDTRPGAIFWGGSSIAHGALYVGNFASYLYALSP